MPNNGTNLEENVQIIRFDTTSTENVVLENLGSSIEGRDQNFILFIEEQVQVTKDFSNLLFELPTQLEQFDLVYFDEVETETRRHFAKPAFDLVLFDEAPQYIGHVILVRTAALLAWLNAGDRETDLSDHTQSIITLIWAFTKSLPEKRIAHVPYPLELPSGLNRVCVKKPSYETPDDFPFVSVVIPSRNGFDLISRTLKGLFEETDYPNFEVLVIDNGSDDPDVLDLYKSYKIKQDAFSVHIKTENFNFSRMINRGLSLSRGDHLLLLNNDVEVIEQNWLKEMVRCMSYANTGIVGAKLLFPDDTIQHAGVIVGMNGTADHWYYKEPRDFTGQKNRLSYRQSMSCVTGAAMLISRKCHEALGNWDEENFAVAYNDVDYCLRAREAGFRTVWTPKALLYHHESSSRRSAYNVLDRWWRLQREKRALKKLHNTQNFHDPAYSPRYELRSKTPKLRKGFNDYRPRTWWTS